MLKEKIKSLAHKYHKDAIALRRHIHQNPELSFQEVATGKFIAEQLKAIGIPFQHGVAENGVVGLIQGKKKGAKTVNGHRMLELQAEKSWKIWNR